MLMLDGWRPDMELVGDGRVIPPRADAPSSAPSAGTASTMNERTTGPLVGFGDWPNDRVPRSAAGLYTVWRGDDFIYVGMSGHGTQRAARAAAGRP